jgi:hypothetical protein
MVPGSTPVTGWHVSSGWREHRERPPGAPRALVSFITVDGEHWLASLTADAEEDKIDVDLSDL